MGAFGYDYVCGCLRSVLIHIKLTTQEGEAPVMTLHVRPRGVSHRDIAHLEWKRCRLSSNRDHVSQELPIKVFRGS